MSEAPICWRAPRELASADGDARLARLAETGRRPWPGARLLIPWLVPPPGLESALFDARRARRLVRGLEAAEAALEGAAAGRAASGADQSRTPRISRVLLVSEDGAERFYRRVERVAERHRPRLWVSVLCLDESQLGAMAYGSGQRARALLVDHKSAAARVLDTLLAADARGDCEA